jgi:hypothetical protein
MVKLSHGWSRLIKTNKVDWKDEIGRKDRKDHRVRDVTSYLCALCVPLRQNLDQGWLAAPLFCEDGSNRFASSQTSLTLDFLLSEILGAIQANQGCRAILLTPPNRKIVFSVILSANLRGNLRSRCCILWVGGVNRIARHPKINPLCGQQPAFGVFLTGNLKPWNFERLQFSFDGGIKLLRSQSKFVSEAEPMIQDLF